MESRIGGQRFVGLHWKGFLWLSTLLLVLSAALQWLHHHHLMQQFQRQREADIHSFHQQISGLVKWNSQRLVRLAGAVSSARTWARTCLGTTSRGWRSCLKGTSFQGGRAGVTVAG
jgi:hypothetical protein